MTVFSSAYCLHHSRTPHSPHFGFLAVQTYLPWRMSQWCAFARRCSGIEPVRSFSTFSTVSPSESPILRDTLNTCVSTAITGLSYTTDAITLAVLRPTPGSFTSSSVSDGTLPPKSSSRVLAIPMRFLALLLGNVMDLISPYTSSNDASASD